MRIDNSADIACEWLWKNTGGAGAGMRLTPPVLNAVIFAVRPVLLGVGVCDAELDILHRLPGGCLEVVDAVDLHTLG